MIIYNLQACQLQIIEMHVFWETVINLAKFFVWPITFISIVRINGRDSEIYKKILFICIKFMLLKK